MELDRQQNDRATNWCYNRLGFHGAMLHNVTFTKGAWKGHALLKLLMRGEI